MKRLFTIIIQIFQRRKQIANMICPDCKSRLTYRDCPPAGIWLACSGCQKEY
jgi:ribosomal protein L37AE/L43A